MLPFLEPDAVALLTGYRQKGKQIEQLRTMGIAFRVNAAGRPIVAVSTIDGVRKPVDATTLPAWTPRLAQSWETTGHAQRCEG